MYEILAQEQTRGGTKSSGGGITVSLSPKANAKEILLAGTHPIRPKDMAAHKKIVADQEESYRYTLNYLAIPSPNYLTTHLTSLPFLHLTTLLHT